MNYVMDRLKSKMESKADPIPFQLSTNDRNIKCVCFYSYITLLSDLALLLTKK